MRPLLRRFSVGRLAFVLPFWFVAAQTQAKKAADDQDQQESYAYILTMDKINKLGEVRKALGEWLENNKQASKRMAEDKSLLRGTLAQRARTLDINHPEVAAIIRKERISTQEYVLAPDVLLKAQMLAGAREEGDTQDYSKRVESVSPANLTFVEQHKEEIRKSMRDVRIRM